MSDYRHLFDLMKLVLNQNHAPNVVASDSPYHCLAVADAILSVAPASIKRYYNFSHREKLPTGLLIVCKEPRAGLRFGVRDRDARTIPDPPVYLLRSSQSTDPEEYAATFSDFFSRTMAFNIEESMPEKAILVHGNNDKVFRALTSLRAFDDTSPCLASQHIRVYYESELVACHDTVSAAVYFGGTLSSLSQFHSSHNLDWEEVL